MFKYLQERQQYVVYTKRTVEEEEGGGEEEVKADSANTAQYHLVSPLEHQILLGNPCGAFLLCKGKRKAKSLLVLSGFLYVKLFKFQLFLRCACNTAVGKNSSASFMSFIDSTTGLRHFPISWPQLTPIAVLALISCPPSSAKVSEPIVLSANFQENPRLM